MAKHRIYIAGPMTGMKDLNVKDFNMAEECLQFNGWSVCNPIRINQDFTAKQIKDGQLTESEKKECARNDLAELLTCDTIYMLQGWEKSPGARAEHAVAVWIGLSITYAVVPRTQK